MNSEIKISPREINVPLKHALVQSITLSITMNYYTDNMVFLKCEDIIYSITFSLSISFLNTDLSQEKKNHYTVEVRKTISFVHVVLADNVYRYICE